MSFCVSCVNGVNWLVLSDQLRHLQKGYHFVKMTIYFLVEHLNTIQTFCTTLTGQYTCYLFDNTKTFCLSMPVTNTLLLFIILVRNIFKTYSFHMKESLKELIRIYFGLIVYAQNACGKIKSIVNVSL